MNLGDRIESKLMALIDALVARRPQPRPDRERLNNCRIISHRGEHDNRRVFENTLAAFDAAVAGGVWGFELDLRWTRDLEPVVIHDPGLGRVFGRPLTVAEATLAELRQACPLVPTLAEVVGRYVGRAHLMIEVKREVYRDPEEQNRVLADTLAPLSPGRDFHLLSLAPEMFRFIAAFPRQVFVPIAHFDCARFGRLALQEGYAGVAGHYLLMSAAVVRRIHGAGGRVGTGYSQSRPCLLREINRGVDWIFSNRAAALQRMLAGLQSASN